MISPTVTLNATIAAKLIQRRSTAIAIAGLIAALVAVAGIVFRHALGRVSLFATGVAVVIAVVAVWLQFSKSAFQRDVITSAIDPPKTNVGISAEVVRDLGTIPQGELLEAVRTLHGLVANPVELQRVSKKVAGLDSRNLWQARLSKNYRILWSASGLPGRAITLVKLMRGSD